MNIVKMFMPKIYFRHFLTWLLSQCWMHYIYVPYSTQKCIRCVPKCLSSWSFWFQDEKKVVQL